MSMIQSTPGVAVHLALVIFTNPSYRAGIVGRREPSFNQASNTQCNHPRDRFAACCSIHRLLMPDITDGLLLIFEHLAKNLAPFSPQWL